MASKSKSTLSDTPNSKASPATPRVSKLSRGVTKSDADTPSPMQNPRLSIDRSSPRPVSSKPAVDGLRSVNSKPTTIDRRSPKLGTLPDKQQIRVSKGSDLQAQLNLLEEDLNKANEQLLLVQKEKEHALDELKKSQKLTEEANEKLKEALVAQKRAEDDSEIEKFRALEIEQVGIDFTEKKENEWQREIDNIRNQHALDIATLLETTEDLQRAKHELAMITDAKNQAMTHADDATKIAEIHVEKVEFLSNEVTRLKGLLESKFEKENNGSTTVAVLSADVDSLKRELKDLLESKIELENNGSKTVAMLNADIDSLRQELAKAKVFEDELTERELSIQQLNVDLEASKMAESYTRSLLEEWQNKVDELENRVESSNQSLVSLEKQFKEKETLLQNAEFEVSDLKQKVKILEITVGEQKVDLKESDGLVDKAKQEVLELETNIKSLNFKLEMLNEEKTKALTNEKIAANDLQILLEEKSKLITELESSKAEEEKSKIAMESLASALHEVSSEARELKEKLLANQTKQEHYETQIEELKNELKSTNGQYETQIEELKNELKSMNERYETMIVDSKHEINLLTREVEQSKDSFDNSKAEWEQKELHFVNCIKQTDEQNSSLEKEVKRVSHLLKEMEQENSTLKDKETKLNDSLMEAESENNYLKQVLGEAKAETMKVKESVLDKENEMQTVIEENEELHRKDADSLKKILELSKLLEEATENKCTEENGELTDSEKDYDLLPKVVEFSEENGHAREEKHKTEMPTKENLSKRIDHVNEKEILVGTNGEVENVNGKFLEEESKEKDSAEHEFKMWESCKIDEKEYSPEREEPEESFEEQGVDSKAESSDSFDQINGLSDNLNNGGVSPMKQEQTKKKKKPLLRKFGSLLKKSTGSTQK